MTDTITLPRSVVEQALNALWATDTEEGTEAYERELEAIKALRAALEQPQVEQEPAAWIERWYGSGPERGWWIVCGRDHIAHLGPAEMSGEAASKIVSAHNTSPPAQRQPLTDEEIFNAIRPLCNNDTNCHAIIGLSIDEYRAIERAAAEIGRSMK